MINIYPSILLETLENKTGFLDRIESKFRIHKNNLNTILDLFKDDYFVLEIWNKRIFNYDTIYFDSPDLYNYYQYQQKKRLRQTIRTRLYKDSNLCFAELKFKNKSKKIKIRQKISTNKHWTWNNEIQNFFQKNTIKYYNKQTNKNLIPILKSTYNRITLVHKNFKERITIDFNINFEKINSNFTKNKKINQIWTQTYQPRHFLLQNLLIIEIKSDKFITEWYKKIRKLGFRENELNCSKFALWIISIGITNKYNNLLPTLNKLKKLK